MKVVTGHDGFSFSKEEEEGKEAHGDIERAAGSEVSAELHGQLPC